MASSSSNDKTETQRQKYMAMDAEERGMFNTWRRAISEYMGVGLTPAQQETRAVTAAFNKDVADCKRCETWRNDLLQTSPLVIFMADNLKKSGFALDNKNMPCMKCDEMRSGGYSSDGVIQLCYNRIRGKGHLETTMAHEMVHAYDDKNFDLDWYNLDHHACTEIRAASLSGDCTWFQEMMRGNLGFLKHHQVCVKRRAVLSLLANPSCKSAKHAEAAVNKVFKSCFTDTRPFDEIY
ncbi:Mitochondrial inner membrane protease atp23 [Coemansia furcata]|uniref:Mitochondrial inner membrane protease atp23 n=1 Tax=Coemansia furcata TaxID=417177 RepID=A0ACC1LRP5_9FUNG|nr:Mitochondrial inner membrane protease atp23 [Coemansia furcata]